MSFNIDKSSALEVKLLELHVSGLGSFELSRVSINMNVNGESTATCEPVPGKDTIKNQQSHINRLSAITPDMRCRVYMKLGNNGNLAPYRSMLFEGRLAGDTIQVLSNPLGSSAQVHINLRHITTADLGGVSVAERTYYHDGAQNIPFRITNYTPYYTTQQFRNTTLDEGRLALYIKQLVNALFLWYTNGGTNSINVNNILKAVPCKVRQDLEMMENGKGGIIWGMESVIDRTFQGAMGSKATLLSVMSTLCNYCLFNLIPTSNALVITPNLNVSRWNDDDVFLSRKRLVNVTIPFTSQRIPIEKVCLNYFAGVRYYSDGGEDVTDPNRNKDWASKYRWPPIDGGGAVLVDPPPILRDVVDVSLSAGSQLLPPRPLSKGGRATNSVNSAGAQAYRYPWDLDTRIGTIAAKLEWSRLAFSQRTLSVGIMPHWIFSPSFAEALGSVYEEGTPWGLLGKTVKLRAPYSIIDSNKSDDIAYIGYVNGMQLDVSVPDARLTTHAVLSNVRTETEDRWAFPTADNPLYDDTEQQPV